MLRHIESGAWVSPDGTLSQDLHKALETDTLADALDFCQKHKLKDVEIVLRFGDPRYDSTIHVSDTLIIRKPSTEESSRTAHKKRS